MRIIQNSNILSKILDTVCYVHETEKNRTENSIPNLKHYIDFNGVTTSRYMRHRSSVCVCLLPHSKYSPSLYLFSHEHISYNY